MSKVLIVFGTLTGNTQNVAEKLQAKLTEAKHEVTLKNITEANPGDFTSHDYLLFGSSTWDDGNLQQDVASFFENNDIINLGLKGKKLAIFGCGDSSYAQFCHAVDLLDEKLTTAGAVKLCDNLKVDGFPDEDANVSKTETFAASVLAKLQ